MSDKPILFSAPMVRALLAGTKTQTRRVIKPRGHARMSLFNGEWSDDYVLDPGNADWRARDLKYSVGDRLYVRETFAMTNHGASVYRADARDQKGDRWPSIQPGDPAGEVLWKPSIHMPRWASRITLTVTDVRVQRLLDISEEDAVAEGVEAMTDCDATVSGKIWKVYTKPKGGNLQMGFANARDSYLDLWDSINGDDSAAKNPWVASYTFTVAIGNIDSLK